MLLAFVARLGLGTLFWSFAPILLLLLLGAAFIKPLLYKQIDQLAAVPFFAKAKTWLAPSLGSLAVALMAGLLAGLSGGQQAPRSIMLVDWFLSLLYFVFLRSRLALKNPQAKQPHRAIYKELASFAIFFAVGLTLVWKALPYPMTWDDLHLIRSYSGEELVSAFHGNWDPDNIETPGLRPFTTLFNHLRYAYFGENVGAQRILLVSLYSLFLAMFAWLAQRFQLPWPLAVAAGILSMAARHNFYHYVWLADGVHLLEAVLLATAFICLAQFIHTKGTIFLIYSAAAWVVALLTREDAIVGLPILISLGYSLMRMKKAPGSQYKTLHLFTASLISLAAAFFLLRGLFIPFAETPGAKVQGIFQVAKNTVFGFTGLQAIDLWSEIPLAIWCFVLIATIGAAIYQAYKKPQMASWGWLLLFGLACLIGLNNDRVNLLLMPITFFSFWVASIWASQILTSRLIRMSASAAAILVVAGSFYTSTIAMEAFHPASSTAVYWDSEFIYGRFAKKATIPAERWTSIREQLNALGIDSADDIPGTYEMALTDPNQTNVFSQLVRAALASSRRRAAGNGTLFVPRLEPFSE